MKICLIGNNLTTLLLANILSKKSLAVDIFSLNSIKHNYKTRSLGITESNLNFLCNYFKNIKNQFNPIYEIKVLIKNNKINKEILFDKNKNTLFSIIKYNKLVSYIKSNLISLQ